ncbi:AraC family transcriptional regulator [Paenibacillus sp. BC26]|uniref:AraC family transcriptional regulator n=1 Tax=Paenibacillus sp. BC26 TaxID=1881032 RepID=UPI0008E63280|nr:AraC family transcriptional regulator [Paenibacillus sp. BC26]SFS74345.1 Helix-turn-helix domain-containing protein [Paenibacillus sp. BC26]
MRASLSVREKFDFSLYHVERAVYDKFRLDMIKPYWTVSFVLEGQVESRTEGNVYIAGSGDVMIYPPQVPFSETATGKGIHLWMLIDMKDMTQLQFFHRFPVAQVVKLLDETAYARVFDDLLGVWNGEHSPLRDYRAFSLTLQLLEYIVSSWIAAGSPGRPEVTSGEGDRFLQVVKYMEDNLGDKITSTVLARILHLHPGYFNRAFKKLFGVSSMQMLRSMRLRKAAQMLVESDYTLAFISEQCGLGDAASISKTFKESFGRTPGQYRQSNRHMKASFISSSD